MRSEWVLRLGWTLLHFLWQGAAIATVYATARRVFASRGPNTRYLLACAALAVMIAAPAVTWLRLAPAAGVPDPVYRIQSSPAPASPRTGAVLADVGPEMVAARVVEVLPWIVMAWMAGATAFGIRLAFGCALARTMRSRQARLAPPEWQRALDRLRARVGVSRPVQLIVSGLVDAPAVVGWWKPVVLVPVGALVGLSAEAVEAVLAHELAHIRRHDYLLGVAQRAAEALLFYHPAVWWVSGQIRAERELCCDDIALACGADAFTYARALAQLEAGRRPALGFAMSALGGSLARRIARLLGRPHVQETSAAPGVLTLLALLVAVGYGMYAQSDARPAFQAASIKRDVGLPGLMMVRPEPGGTLRAQNAPLILLIQNAYQVQAFQVIGGPSWINTDGYDVEAKPEGPADREHVWKMLQTLLADRFQLTLHRETRDVAGYALTAVNAAKLPAAKADGCVPAAPDALPPPPRQGSPGPCGRLWIQMSPNGLNVTGGRIQMPELVRILGVMTGKPVLDRTETGREFDVKLTFTPDEVTMGLPGAGGPHDSGGMRLPSDPEKPNLLAALQEQLGLKLSAAKVPVEVLVIDRVERPTAN
jgi:uncharacterized protein (TIGR03435 family)